MEMNGLVVENLSPSLPVPSRSGVKYAIFYFYSAMAHTTSQTNCVLSFVSQLMIGCYAVAGQDGNEIFLFRTRTIQPLTSRPYTV